MSRRNKLKFDRIRLYLKKNVFSMKYPVRNLLIVMISMAVVFMSVMAVNSLSSAGKGDKKGQKTTLAAGAEVTEATVTEEAEVTTENPAVVAKSEAVKDDKAANINKSAVTVATVAESKYDMTGKFIVTTDLLNVRREADEGSDVLGMLAKGTIGELVKVEGLWAEIKTDSVSGFVKSEFILTGDEASKLAEQFDKNPELLAPSEVEVTEEETEADSEETDTQDDYQEDSEEIYDDTEEITTEEVTEAETEEPTTEADTEKTVTEEVTTEEITTEEITTEEVTTEEITTEEVTTEHIPSTDDLSIHSAGGFSADDVRLLAAIVYAESGSESYEGQVAVANVVLNRLYTGRWGGTLHDVIYAPYQFTATETWAFKNVYDNGAPDTTMSAVYDALNGYNNIGGYLSFRPTWYMDPSTVEDHKVIGNHCFF